MSSASAHFAAIRRILKKMDLSCEGGGGMGRDQREAGERWESIGEGGEGGVGLNMIKFMICIYEILKGIDNKMK